MQSASLLSSTHLVENVTDAAHIMQNAMLLGTNFGGTTATQALESILPTLTNQSALRLDMYGLSGDQVQELQDQYQEAGMASGEAFAQAFLDVSDELLGTAGLIDATGTIDTQTDSVAGLQAAWDNAKVSLAAYVEMTGLLGAIAKFVQDTGNMLDETAAAEAILAEYEERLNAALQEGLITQKQYSDAIYLLGLRRNDITWGDAETDDFLAIAQQAVDELTVGLPYVAKAFDDLDAKTAAWDASIHEVDASIDATQMQLEHLSGRKFIISLELQTTFAAGASATQESFDLAEVRNQMAQIDADRALSFAQGMSDIFGTDWENTTPAEKGYYDAETASLSDSNNEYEVLLQERQQMLENYATSALTLTSVTDRDWWETSLGEYADKPDEYIRRLNSALNDANSEWKWMLEGRTGDAAQLYVAQQSDLWTSGQWGQLGTGFDEGASRQAIIDSIRQNVTAQRAQEALIQSIITDPALADIGLTSSEVASITGDTDTLAQGVASSLATTNIASIVTNSFGEQLQAEEQVWVSYGELIVTWLKVGMSNNNQMASGLAELLFPELQEMFEGRQ
jgi:hypothetical protein